MRELAVEDECDTMVMITTVGTRNQPQPQVSGEGAALLTSILLQNSGMNFQEGEDHI